MAEFVDKDGNVFHKGKEQPKLKGTLPPTKVKPKKRKTKRRTKEQILIDRHNKKKEVLKKAKKKLSVNWKINHLIGITLSTKIDLKEKMKKNLHRVVINQLTARV